MNTSLIAQLQNSLVVSDGLIGYWSFNENTGSVAYDYSGNNRHGTLVGSPLRVDGKRGIALSFNGSSNYVNLTDFLSGVTQFTFVTWVKPTILEDWKGIIAKYLDDNHCVTLQTNANGNISLDVDNTAAGSNYGRTSTVDLTTGSWYHIAMAYNGAGATNADRVKLYVNSITSSITFTGNITSSTFTNTAPVVVGSLNTSNLQTLNGAVDEIRIYNRTLSQSEITTLYQSNFGGGQIHPSVADWRRRVVVNGGAEPSQNTLNALTNFYRSLDSNGLTSKMTSVNCFVPDNLSASITPLIKTYGNDPWTNTSFVVGDLTVGGLKGNGSNKKLDSNVILSTAFPVSSSHGITVYRSADDANPTRSCCAGCEDNLGGYLALYLQGSDASTLGFSMNASTGQGRMTASVSDAGTPVLGYYSLNRTTVNSASIYQANSSASHHSLTSISTIGGYLPNQNLMFYAYHPTTGDTAFSTARLSFAAVHSGLTSTESSTFFNLIQKMRQDLGGGYV